MAAHPTVSEIYLELKDELHSSFNFERGLQALMDRSFSKGLCPESETEISMDISDDSTEIQQLNGDDCWLLNHTLYHSLISVRHEDGGPPIKVIDLSAFHARYVAGKTSFVDYGRVTYSGTDYKYYRIPPGYNDTEGPYYALVRRRAPNIKNDDPISNTNEIPFFSPQIAHIGLMAIGWEQQGDINASNEYWARFSVALHDQTMSSEGIKDWSVGVNHHYDEEPCNFM